MTLELGCLVLSRPVIDQSKENQVAATDERDHQATARSVVHVISLPVIMVFILAYVEAIC